MEPYKKMSPTCCAFPGSKEHSSVVSEMKEQNNWPVNCSRKPINEPKSNSGHNEGLCIQRGTSNGFWMLLEYYLENIHSFDWTVKITVHWTLEKISNVTNNKFHLCTFLCAQKEDATQQVPHFLREQRLRSHANSWAEGGNDMHEFLKDVNQRPKFKEKGSISFTKNFLPRWRQYFLSILAF